VPKADVPRLTELGVRAVFTPADFDLAAVLARMAELIGGSAAA
jgi:methylmalonyl-CoA mutase cobalamin-binding subunit